jgi:hypothetical protein
VLCWWIVYLLLDLNQQHLGLWYQSLKVLDGVGFNATNDKLILDTDITLRGDITATNKVIGTVAGLASKATPTAISERVNSALLVDCISAAGSKSTAFGALVSIVKNTELFASAPSTLVSDFYPNSQQRNYRHNLSSK